jgi:hypothetical protein
VTVHSAVEERQRVADRVSRRRRRHRRCCLGTHALAHLDEHVRVSEANSSTSSSTRADAGTDADGHALVQLVDAACVQRRVLLYKVHEALVVADL